MSNGQRATRRAVYQGRQRLGQGLAATVGKGQEGFLHVGEKKTRRTGCSENGVQGTKGEHPEGGGRELATSAAMPLCCRAGMGRKGSKTRAGENAGSVF